MIREVELGCESWTSFASGCSSTAVQRTLWLFPSTVVETAIARCTSRWAMARGHRLNTSFVLAAVHGLSGLFRAVFAVEPSLFCPPPPPPLVSLPNKPSRFCGRKAKWTPSTRQCNNTTAASKWMKMKMKTEDSNVLRSSSPGVCRLECVNTACSRSRVIADAWQVLGSRAAKAENIDAWSHDLQLQAARRSESGCSSVTAPTVCVDSDSSRAHNKQTPRFEVQSVWCCLWSSVEACSWTVPTRQRFSQVTFGGGPGTNRLRHNDTRRVSCFLNGHFL